MTIRIGITGPIGCGKSTVARWLGELGAVVIDADVKESDEFESFPQSEPAHLADAVYSLHRQPKTAWTSEMDFRPWNEKFWEHC